MIVAVMCTHEKEEQGSISAVNEKPKAEVGINKISINIQLKNNIVHSAQDTLSQALQALGAVLTSGLQRASALPPQIACHGETRCHDDDAAKQRPSKYQGS
jgi:hypothetical protein